MPSRKQRKRRAKSLRHEWEEVWVDDEGNEVEPPPEEEMQSTSRNGKRDAVAKPAHSASGRQVQPPSWERVAKRGLIFAPLMFLTVTFLSSNLTIAQRIVNTAFLLAFFLPFSYVMDSLMYRMAQKRAAGTKR